MTRARSAERAPTVLFAVGWLLALMVSAVDDSVGVFEMTVPGATEELTWTTRVKVAVVRATNEPGVVQETLPLATAHTHPAGKAKLTKLVLAGTLSLMIVSVTSDGPGLVAVIV